MSNQIKPIKPKFWYDVKIECMLPATLTYRVMAETPEQASTLIKNTHPNNVRYKLNSKRDLKIMVYDAGSSLIRFIKNLAGL